MKIPVIHWRNQGREVSLSVCGAKRGLNRNRSVHLTDVKRDVTCLNCRAHIKPWERGDQR